MMSWRMDTSRFPFQNINNTTASTNDAEPLQDITAAVLQVYLPDDERSIIVPHRSSLVTPEPPNPNRSSGFNFPMSPPQSGRERSQSVSPMKLNNGYMTPTKKRLISSSSSSNPPPKRLKLNLLDSSNYELGLKGLSNEQLVALIKDLAQEFPSVKQKLLSGIPTPDLGPVEEHLQELYKNVYKSLPRRSSRLRRFSSSSDAVSYSRAEVHLEALRSYIVNFGSKFLRAEQWGTVVDFVIIAWSAVGRTPVWHNEFHNEIPVRTYAFLANALILALQNGNFKSHDLITIQNKIERLSNLKNLEKCTNLIKSKIAQLEKEGESHNEKDIEKI